jgi:hypothetical protein
MSEEPVECSVNVWESTMIDVTVKVPEDRVAEFYSMFGSWLSGSFPPLPSSPGMGTADDSGDNHQPWSDSDFELAAKVWNKLSDPAKRLFSTLIDEPERRFRGDELAEMLDIPNGRHGVAGVLAWSGRHSFKVDRKWPWRFEYPEEGAPVEYWFEPAIAALFREARDGQGNQRAGARNAV